jgi:hypothetical protein
MTAFMESFTGLEMMNQREAVKEKQEVMACHAIYACIDWDFACTICDLITLGEYPLRYSLAAHISS